MTTVNSNGIYKSIKNGSHDYVSRFLLIYREL